MAKDRKVLESGQLLDIPVEPIQTRHKGERLLHTRKIPILAPDGTPQYLLGISEDITERHRAEEALEAARAAADHANRAKTEFLSRMSHELRTPLNAVLGFGQLLQLEELGPEQRENADHIVRAGAHLLALIDDVLDISRMESGQLRLSLEPVRIGEVVAEAVGMVAPMAAAQRVRLIVEPAGLEERHVRADRQRLRQVLVNLLVNAVKYNREGGRVTVSCTAGPGDRVRLVVADTGIGVAQANLDRLFQPFERLGAEHSEVEGTGLGLALANQLVDAMGGVIGVESEVGVGSSFWVDLSPATAPDDDSAVRSLAPPPSVPRPVAVAGPRRVLYVEDNLSNVKLVERVMARRPEVELLVAMQGSLALDLARQHQPCLVLLDLHLPDMAGEEVLQRFMADPRMSHIPVVVLSADATPNQVQRLLDEGARDYLTKPFDIPRLLAIVDGTAPAPVDAVDQPASPGGAVLDPATVRALLELAGDTGPGRDGVRDAVTTFVEEGASRLAGLRLAVSGGDAAGAQRLAHSLAGSSATFGARQVAAHCRRLEAQAKAGDLGGAPDIVEEVAALFEDAVTALHAELLSNGRRAGSP